MFWETIQVHAHLVTDYLVQGRATMRTNEMTSHTSIVQHFLQSGVKWSVSLSNQNIEGVVPSIAYVVCAILVV